VEYCIKGPIEYDIEGNHIPLTEGAVLVIPPHIPHHQKSPKASDSYLLKFQLDPDRHTIVQPTWLQLTGPERQIMEPLLAAVVYEHDGRADGRDEMIAALVEQVLIWIQRWSKIATEERAPAGSDARERVRLVGDMLRRQYWKRFSVDELAAQACLSRSRFLEVFRAEFGTPPIAFHTRARMEKAVELARYTGMSWQQIAAQLGYDDPAYFSRAFKKAMGASPSSYRSGR